MGLRDLLYRAYEARLSRQLMGAPVPAHIGVILDGNRRWAKQVGAAAAHGHRQGAANVQDFLQWASEAGVQVVTLWMLSTDNLHRPEAELRPLLEIICDAVEEIGDRDLWPVSIVGNMDLLPEAVVGRLTDVAERTAALSDLPEKPMTVNIAVSYGGRQEIADAVRAHLYERAEAGVSLADAAASLTVEDIAAYLYTRGQPDPDLVIRTSGEQRLSGFLLWQTVYSEYYFCEVYWPDFRHVDFLRALRDYSQRERRRGK
ncbi:MAG: isoprenyl transferase [Buchananella hordeovulneris]|nr:isoprenyl transferase [Buchananella hordeovulneris]